jgi:hypothetical protein
MLGIHDVCVERQKPVLYAWLSKNTPSPALRISLRRNGFGLLLDDIFGRPRLQATGSSGSTTGEDALHGRSL